MRELMDEIRGIEVQPLPLYIACEHVLHGAPVAFMREPNDNQEGQLLCFACVTCPSYAERSEFRAYNRGEVGRC